MDHREKASNSHPSDEPLAYLSSDKIIHPRLHQSHGGNCGHRREDNEGPAHLQKGGE